MKLNLENKSVIVTGASNGIGLAIAKGFLGHKARVVGFDLAPPGENPGFEFIECSVTDAVAITALKEVHAKQGIDILVNNAGIAANNLATSIKNEEIDRAFDINFKALYRLSVEYFRLNKKKGGNIINIASVLALTGSALGSLYGGTKAAVVGATRSLAIEWAKNGFRVNAVCPGLVETAMTERVRNNINMLEANMKNIPMKRFAKPEEIANVCVFLGSDASSYITAQTITVDGGMTVKR